MIKSVLPAAVAAIALAAPFAGRAQTVQPMQLPSPYSATNASVADTGQMRPGETETTTTTTDVNATTTGQPQPGPNDYASPAVPDYGMAAPPIPYAPPISPRTTWIPGHYNWDPNTSNYVWTPGQYIEAPTATAQWIPGHWEQTPTAWIWINGGWR